jgi:hypothetical protein
MTYISPEIYHDGHPLPPKKEYIHLSCGVFFFTPLFGSGLSLALVIDISPHLNAASGPSMDMINFIYIFYHPTIVRLGDRGLYPQFVKTISTVLIFHRTTTSESSRTEDMDKNFFNFPL